MTSRTSIVSSIACATLLAIVSLAQDNPAGAQPGNPDIASLPAGRGVYYRASGGWVALSPTSLMPLMEGRAVALDILNVGSDHAGAQMPGPHAIVQINDARPTFYMRGIPVSELYLVRAVLKPSYRELRMPISGHFWEWAHFREKDLAEIDLQAVGNGVVTVKPRAGLKPGEYALATLFDSERWIRLGYDFGLLAGSAGQ